MTNKNTIITIILLLAIVLGGYYYTRTSKEAGIQNAPQGKINVDEVCNQALIYMTFTDSASAELFVQECKEGKHPQVIEDYKTRMGLGAGAEI